MFVNKLKGFILFSLLSLVCILSCNTTNPPAPINNNTHPEVANLRGVNVVAGEIAWKGEGIPVVSGTHYQFLKPADIDYLVSKKINFIRLLFSWEYLQPNLNSDFPDTEYNRKFTETVSYATSKGLFVLVEPHGGSDPNFWRYKGKPVGSAEVPITAFADFWKRMAWKFGNNWRVSYGLGNEPHGIDTATVFAAQQAAINAIRATTSRQMIFAELNHFSHIWTRDVKWTDPSGKMTNAQGMLSLKDPINNTVFEIHEYFAPGGSGTSSEVESETATLDRIKGGVEWARANNIKLHLGEFGADKNNPLSQKAVINVLNYINQNTDVIIGWAWWAYGPHPWWTNYRFTLTPPGGDFNKSDEKWSWISPYLTGLGHTSPTLPLPASVPDAGVVDAGIRDAGIVSHIVDAGKDSGAISDAGMIVTTLSIKTRITADAGTFYCVEFDVVNNDSSPASWHLAKIDLADSIIQNKKFVEFPWDTWNVSPSSRTGIVEMIPAIWNKTVQPKTKKVFGFCAEYGLSKKKAELIKLD